MSNLSNWREEFNLSEVVTGKMTDDEDLRKVDDKKNIKNKVIINPKLSEAVKEIGGEVLSIVETDTTAQKQRLDMKQMILDRQKLRIRRRDFSQKKKEGEKADDTTSSKQSNVIANESVLTTIGRTKKKVEKKPEKAMDAGAKAKRMLARKIHAKYVSGSTENVPDDIREEDKAFNYVLAKLKAKHGDGVMTKGDKMPQPGAAQKKKNAEIRAKRAKEDGRDATQKASDGRYSDNSRSD